MKEDKGNEYLYSQRGKTKGSVGAAEQVIISPILLSATNQMRVVNDVTTNWHVLIKFTVGV